MRQRFLHRTGSSAPSIAQLIQSHDVLSIREQEDVILYLARNLRYTIILLRFVACLHFVLAVLYLCMFVTGVSLVDAVSLGVAAPRARTLVSASSRMTSWGTILRHVTHGNVHTSSVSIPTSRKSGVGQSLRLARFVKLFLFSFAAIPSLLLLLSASFLLMGGVCVWRACRTLLVNIDELLGQASPLAPRRGLRVEYEECCPEAGCVASARTRSQTRNHRHVCKRGTRVVVIHAVLSILSTLASLYWFYLLFKHYTSRILHSDIKTSFVRDSKLPEGVRVVLDVVLVVWQPLFHAALKARAVIYMSLIYYPLINFAGLTISHLLSRDIALASAVFPQYYYSEVKKELSINLTSSTRYLLRSTEDGVVTI